MGDLETLVLVDGYSSGSQLPTVMRERGWQCVHVQSLAHPPPYYLATFRPEDYVAHYNCDGDYETLAAVNPPLAPPSVLPSVCCGSWVPPT